MFSCEICEIFKITFFYRTSPVAASDLLKVISLKRFMQGILISSFCTTPCTKPSTRKTTIEIEVFEGIFNRTAKIYNCMTFSKQLLQYDLQKENYLDHFAVLLNHGNMFTSLKNKLSITFLSNFAR